jgi:hypothetical protein
MMDQKFQLDRLPPTDCPVNQCNPPVNTTTNGSSTTTNEWRRISEPNIMGSGCYLLLPEPKGEEHI